MRKRIVLMAIFGLFLFSNPSFGQTPEDEMIAAVSVICPHLSALNKAGLLNAAEQDLFFSCRDVLKEPAQAVQRNAAGQLTTDETQTMNTLSVEITSTQKISILSRLASLRGGGALGGVALNSNSPFDSGLLFAGPVSFSDQSPLAESVGSRLSYFVNGNFGTGNRDESTREPGFDFSGMSLTIGADYRLSDIFFVGVATGYSQTRADIDADGGDVDLDGYGISIYGTYAPGDLYFDLIGTYGRKDYETRRHVNYNITSRVTPGTTTTVDQTFDSDTNANEWSLSLGSGYNFTHGALTFGPQARLNYLTSQIDAYTEKLARANTNPGFSLALATKDQDFTSFTSNVGANVAYAITTGMGVLTPNLRVEWIHEFENDARTIKARYVNGPKIPGSVINIPGDEPDRDFLSLGMGVSTVFTRGIMVFVDYSTILLLEDITNHVGTAGVRFEF